MPDREETERLLELLRQSRPKKMFDHFERTDAGLMCVLKYLIKADRPVSAGDKLSYERQYSPCCSAYQKT